MKKNPNQHVVPNPDGGWYLKEEGNSTPLAFGSTQSEMIAAGRKSARDNQVELVIHRPNGRIREKDSYGNDPFPPRG